MKIFLLSIGLTMLADLIQLGSPPQIIEHDGQYERIALTDSTTLEVYEGDSILVVFTACSPQCSSHARIYNKEWRLLQEVTPPFSSIFPLATIENGRIIWKDNDTWSYQSTL